MPNPTGFEKVTEPPSGERCVYVNTEETASQDDECKDFQVSQPGCKTIVKQIILSNGGGHYFTSILIKICWSDLIC